MIWYVKQHSLHELNDVPKGDTRGFIQKLHGLLEEEKAFTLHGYEHSLTPKTKKVFETLIEKGVFVKVIVR